MKTYIIGHRKPDLDSVVAAISFSSLWQKQGNDALPVIVEPINKETEFVLNKFGFPTPPIISASDIRSDDQIILVDHNEADQRLEGLNPEQIVGIYDHHKLNISLSNPIQVQVYPVGSSNTICYKFYKQNNLEIDPKIASLMLSAILSDTVGLKSSTTTETDRTAVSDLSVISGITDIDALTLEIFKSKSNIGSLTDEQVITNDYKIFEFGGKKVFISQIETVEQESLISSRKQNLLPALEKTKQNEAVDYIFLAITDILAVNTKLVLSSSAESDLATISFGGIVTDNILDIGPRMSRKKDIAPFIEKALQN